MKNKSRAQLSAWMDAAMLQEFKIYVIARGYVNKGGKPLFGEALGALWSEIDRGVINIPEKSVDK